MTQANTGTRFFFDVFDGSRFDHDEIGTVLASRDEVRVQSTTLLPALASDVLPDGNHRTFVVRVRDESGRYIFEATMVMSTGFLD
ncbi:DUF6894 family protein [Tianweitania sediminis]|uniref:DUF6894 domain-containing protein n=1 Tax=Tianweitania sediminis TaxID=1502156 RepID=A0A8J7RHV4_9HYPH|nr:hypothetical protein [Tianweitania sediminis]MBP0438716.1 hypothetical protein [Tianweitania sediminis]